MKLKSQNTIISDQALIRRLKCKDKIIIEYVFLNKNHIKDECCLNFSKANNFNILINFNYFMKIDFM